MDFIWTCLWLLSDPKTWLIIVGVLIVFAGFSQRRSRF